MLHNENIERIRDENKILEEMFNTCDNRESAVFEAGAGSGKTYALVECIKHISVKKHDDLLNHNQKIACITYTNVAANNIRKRIGNSNLVLVSTIHERIWDIIKNQQNILLKLHLEKLTNEINRINQELRDNEDYGYYRSLSDSEQDLFLKLMMENRNKFYDSYNFKAEPFRQTMKSIEGFSPFINLLKNCSNFKNLVRNLYRINDYEDCLVGIREKKFKTIIYDSKYNTDRLARMTISHDTVLEYGKKAIQSGQTLKQMVIDKYPYILIDEYQDTSKDVVEIMKMLDDYSKEINHDFYVAYFGDSAQSIYDGRVGDDLSRIHVGIKPIKKLLNRRSCEEIINIGNKVRNDSNMKQVSIFNDSKQGIVKFYKNEMNIDQFISLCKQELNISSSNKLHCLIPKNKDIATLCHFDKLYDVFCSSDYYHGSNYNSLNDELLSNDIKKLGEVQLAMYKIIKLILDVKDDNNPIHNIEQLPNCSDMSLIELKNVINKLREINGNTLLQLLNSLFAIYNNGDKYIRRIIDSLFPISDDLTLETVKGYFIGKLFDQSVNKIDKLLELEYDELINWYNYIIGDETGEVVYHTIHASKGEEYDNVAIVLGNDFRKKDNYFYNFFLNYGKDDGDEKLISARNLLYVAFTRAKYNLYILYTDDIIDIEDNIEKIFGKITGVPLTV